MNDILKELSKPFPPSEITFKPGATAKDGSKCMAMAYGDLRAYMDRLDEVCGMDWSVTYTPWGERLIAHVTINGVTRSSTGEPDTQSEKREIGGTVTEAQAFKRACAMFGLGRYLYNLPSVWVEFDSQRRTITEAGQAQLAARYKAWYEKQGQGVARPQTHTTTSKSAAAQGVASTPVTQADSEVGVPFMHVPSAPPEYLTEFHAIGQMLYGKEWESVSRRNIDRVTGGRTENDEQMSEAEVRKLIAGMKALEAKRNQPDAKRQQVPA